MNIVIIGVGTQAMVVADIIVSSNNFNLAGFIGNKEEATRYDRSTQIHGVPFLGDHDILGRLSENDISGFVVAVGDNSVRERFFFEAKNAGLLPVNAVSRRALIEDSVRLGKGCIVSPGAILSHGTQLEDDVVIDPGVTIDVGARIGSHASLHTGSIVGGNCVIEKNVTIGTGAILLPGLSIGKYQTIAPGSVVTESLPGLFRPE